MPLAKDGHTVTAELGPQKWYRSLRFKCNGLLHLDVVEGDTVGSLRVFATPGHTPGHIALLDTRNDALIAGDAFSSLFGLKVSGHLHFFFPFPALATWNKRVSCVSAEILVQLAPRYLAPGRAALPREPVAKMKALLKAEAKSLGTASKRPAS